MKLKYVIYSCILLVSLISLVGCTNDTSGEFVVIDENDSIKSEEIPSLKVDVKVEGNKAIILIDTNLRISKEQYGKEKTPGEGHIHLYLNNGEKQGVTSVPFEIEGLETGQHSVRVSLHNNDHTPYGVSKTIEFHIKE